VKAAKAARVVVRVDRVAVKAEAGRAGRVVGKVDRVVARVDRVAVKAEAGRADRVVARVDQVVGARVARVVARGAPGEARVEAGKTADCPTHEPQ
jgi:hypothetical protein